MQVNKQEVGNSMIGLEALQSVQFVTAKGKRLAVLSADVWVALVDLKAAGDDRKRAGWLEVR